MKRVLEGTENSVDLGVLIAIISQAYTASYRGSSLKVRRSCRRLLGALEKAQARQNGGTEPDG